MGIDAIVFGVDPYKKELALMGLLPYPTDWYEGVPEGQLICGMLYRANTTDESRLLADCLGVDIESMYWQVRPNKIDPTPALDPYFNTNSLVEAIQEFRILSKHGWKLYYEPCA